MPKATKRAKRVLCLISGGIDSPVAAYMMGKKGCSIDYVFFYNEPYASIREKEIAEACARQVSRKLGQAAKAAPKVRNGSGRFFLVQHGPVLREILTKCPRRLQCVLCRRMMLRVSEKIAKKSGSKALVTGDSLGQVASQTLDNLAVISRAVKIPILRPLLGFDKTETTKIADSIGTYQFSKHHKCCGITPIKPRTKARLYEAKDAEKMLNIKKLVQEAFRNKKMIVLK